MRYAHHVPKADAAAKLTEFVNRERGASESMYRSRENSEELDGSPRTDSDSGELIATH